MNNADEIMKPFLEYASFMNDRIQSGIEHNRKSVLSVKIVDENKKVVPGVRVEMEQLSSDFKFGANLFMLEEFDHKEQNEKYQAAFADLFNIATLPFYWKDLEIEPGKPRYAKDSVKCYRRPAPDLCLEYCRKHNIEPKAHCLNYAAWTPDWVPADVQQSKMLLAKRFRELGERYGAQIPSWEVTNEMFWGSGLAQKMPFYREPDFLDWSFRTAETYFPGSKLIINEATPWVWGNCYRQYGNYYQQIEKLLAGKRRVDAIGMQFHMFYRREQAPEKTYWFYCPGRMYEIMDLYAKFNRPLQVTEVTVPAYSKLAADEEMQAEILKNVYSMWFSHEAMDTVIYWNLVDGFAAFAPQGDMTAGENYYHGGLLRYDFSEKPAYRMLKKLITEEWRTGKTEAETDAFGIAARKVFHGNYKLKIYYQDQLIEKTVHAAQKEANWFEIQL